MLIEIHQQTRDLIGRVATDLRTWLLVATQALLTVFLALVALIGPACLLGFGAWSAASRIGLDAAQSMYAGLGGWLIAALIAVGPDRASAFRSRWFSSRSAPGAQNRAPFRSAMTDPFHDVTEHRRFT